MAVEPSSAPVQAGPCFRLFADMTPVAEAPGPPPYKSSARQRIAGSLTDSATPEDAAVERLAQVLGVGA